MEILAGKSFAWGLDIQVYFRDRNRGVVAEPTVFRVLKPEEEGLEQRPTFQLKAHEAQQLVDQLWNCGIRPTEGSGSAGSLAATERHLADMKKIAFHALNIPLPERSV